MEQTQSYAIACSITSEILLTRTRAECILTCKSTDELLHGTIPNLRYCTNRKVLSPVQPNPQPDPQQCNQTNNPNTQSRYRRGTECVNVVQPKAHLDISAGKQANSTAYRLLHGWLNGQIGRRPHRQSARQDGYPPSSPASQAAAEPVPLKGAGKAFRFAAFMLTHP